MFVVDAGTTRAPVSFTRTGTTSVPVNTCPSVGDTMVRCPVLLGRASTVGKPAPEPAFEHEIMTMAVITIVAGHAIARHPLRTDKGKHMRRVPPVCRIILGMIVETAGSFTGRSLRAVCALLVISTVLAACASGASKPPSSGIAIVASFYPLAEAAQQVGGSLVSVGNLTAPGVEPHDLELTPHQIAAIDTADVVLYLGGGFQPAVEDALGDASGVAIDATASLRSLPVPSGEPDASLTADPHVWLDPTLYRQIVDGVRSALDQADPQHAETFDANAMAYDERLQALDGDFRSGLAHCQRTVIVTSHAAFGYLSARYGLTQEPISGLSPEAEPTAKRLADLAALVQRRGVTTIFTEELVSPKVAETLASETGVSTAVLNPLESLTPDEAAAGADYVSVMHDNLATLRTALGCT